MKLKMHHVSSGYRIFLLFHFKLWHSKGKQCCSQKCMRKHCQWEGSHGKDKVFSCWQIMYRRFHCLAVCEGFQIQLVCSGVVFCCQSLWHLLCATEYQPADHLRGLLLWAVPPVFALCCLWLACCHMIIFYDLNFYKSKRLNTVSLPWKNTYQCFLLAWIGLKSGQLTTSYITEKM